MNNYRIITLRERPELVAIKEAIEGKNFEFSGRRESGIINDTTHRRHKVDTICPFSKEKRCDIVILARDIACR